MKIKYLSIVVISILIISVLANVYSFKKLSEQNEKSNKSEMYNDLLKENEHLKSDLENEKESAAPSEKINKDSENKKEVVISEMKNSAERYIEFAYNVNADNYATLKKNAHNYMTGDMVDTLYSSDGINEDKINLTTKVSDIEIYESENSKSVIASYNMTLDFNNGYEEKSENFILLNFKIQDGIYKVSSIQAINDIGGV